MEQKSNDNSRTTNYKVTDSTTNWINVLRIEAPRFYGVIQEALIKTLGENGQEILERDFTPIYDTITDFIEKQLIASVYESEMDGKEYI